MTDKFTPANLPPTVVVADLDAMLASRVGFNYRGKVRMLKPLSTGCFLRFMDDWEKFGAWQRGKEAVEAEVVVKRLHQLFSTVCEDISVEDCHEMEMFQVTALVALILDTVSGKVYNPDLDDAKKKAMRKTLADFPRPN